MTPKTKTYIYHAVVQSTIAYAGETGCLKEKKKEKKKVAKLNSTEMDFW